MLVHAGKYRTKDKLKTKLPGVSHHHSARKQGRLILQCYWAHTGQYIVRDEVFHKEKQIKPAL